MYILTAGYGFMKTIKEVMRVAEAGSEQWKGFQLSQGQGRDEVSSDAEMEMGTRGKRTL